MKLDSGFRAKMMTIKYCVKLKISIKNAVQH